MVNFYDLCEKLPHATEKPPVLSSPVFLVRKAAVTTRDTDAAPSKQSAFIDMTNMHVTGHFR